MLKYINYFPEYTPLELNEGELVARCSLCNKKAILFDFDEKNGLVRVGSAQRSYIVKFREVKKLREKLEAGEYRHFHDFLIQEDYEGLDYYCPECNKIYCIDHYQITPYFENMFYEYSTGKCPLGHERIVDD